MTPGNLITLKALDDSRVRVCLDGASQIEDVAHAGRLLAAIVDWIAQQYQCSTEDVVSAIDDALRNGSIEYYGEPQ